MTSISARLRRSMGITASLSSNPGARMMRMVFFIVYVNL